MPDRDALDMAALEARFRRRLSERRLRLVGFAGPPCQREALAREAHSLAGAAALHGHVRLADAARHLDAALRVEGIDDITLSRYQQDLLAQLDLLAAQP